MNIQLYFWISLAIAVIGIISGILNLALVIGANKGSFGGVVGRHILAAILYVIGGAGVIGFGIAWIIQALKA